MVNTIYGLIYRTFNDITGDTYIGQTTLTGWKLNYYLGSGKHLKRAINKYGRCNFHKEILCNCINRDQLDRMERLYISLFKPEYNIDLGGNTSGKHSKETGEKIRLAKIKYCENEEHRKKMSEWSSGRKMSDEARAKSSKSHIGLHNHLGFTHDEYTRKKMSIAIRRAFDSKPVVCIETGIVYGCANEPSMELGIYNVGKVCQGKYKTAGGYHWRYATDSD